jgi:hypothetical protein
VEHNSVADQLSFEESAVGTRFAGDCEVTWELNSLNLKKPTKVSIA